MSLWFFFLLHSSLFHCPTCPDHCMSFLSLSSPPAFTSLTGDILSYFLHLCFSALSPSSLPHDPCLSHPPTVQPSLSSFVFSLFSACFVCVCVCDCIFPLTDKRDVLLLLSSRRGSVAELQQRTEHAEADTRCLSERSTTRSRVEFWQPGAFSKFQMCPRILELPAVRLDVLTCKL